MGETMKAMILEKPAPIESKPLKLVELPVPEPGYGEILVKVNMCGLCHTDLHTVEGDLELPVLPIIPGHQIVGTVVKRGDGVHGHEVGERVGAAWLNSTCGICSFCKRGLENMCENARFTGFHVNGGYAEYVVLPADFVYRLPDGFSDRDAAPRGPRPAQSGAGAVVEDAAVARLEVDALLEAVVVVAALARGRLPGMRGR